MFSAGAIRLRPPFCTESILMLSTRAYARSARVQPKTGTYAKNVGAQSKISSRKNGEANEVSKKPRSAIGKRKQPDASQSGEIKFRDMTFLHHDVRTALRGLKLEKPTPIQRLALPIICEGHNALCAAETGSGKTLAYLLPMVSRLRTQETEEGLVTRLKRPRAIVIVPSTELARQVLKVAKDLSHDAPLKAVGLFGGQKAKRVNEGLAGGADVLVATPGLLQKYMDQGDVMLSDVCYAAIDEADTLFKEGFAEDVFKVLKPLTERKLPKDAPEAGKGAPGAVSQTRPAAARPVQFVVATATVTRPFLRTLGAAFPNMREITTPKIHKCFDSVRHTFVRVKGHDDTKQNVLLGLLDLLKGARREKTMVFCNTHRSTEWLSSVLTERRIVHMKLHSYQSAAERKSACTAFVNGDEKLILCTDVASRGIDTIGVKHVINFDFPKTVTDYLHRAGRTGRMGSEGQVTSIYSTKDAALAHKIELAVNKDHSLSELFREMAEPEEYGKNFKPASSAYGLDKPANLEPTSAATNEKTGNSKGPIESRPKPAPAATNNNKKTGAPKRSFRKSQS